MRPFLIGYRFSASFFSPFFKILDIKPMDDTIMEAIFFSIQFSLLFYQHCQGHTFAYSFGVIFELRLYY